MKEITKIRKAVYTMANERKKVGYTLSQAFKMAKKPYFTGRIDKLNYYKLMC